MRELKIIALLTLVVIGAAAVKVAVGQQQAQPLGIEEVKDSLYMITGSGGNVAARVTPTGVILYRRQVRAQPRRDHAGGRRRHHSADHLRTRHAPSRRPHVVTLRSRMTQLIRQGVPKDDVVNKLQTDDINWLLTPNGLFVQRSVASFYDEIQGER